MTLLVFVTERCENDARTHGLFGEIERFRERVESAQGTSQFDPFPPPYFVKKKLGGRQGRLIADHRKVGDHAILVFLAILIRGDKHYEEFSADPAAYGQRHFANLISDEAITKFVEQRTKESLPPEKPSPDGEEYGFLYEAFSHRSGSAREDLVCETEGWVSQVSQDRIAKQLAILCSPCLQLLSKEVGLHFADVPGKPSWKVWGLRTPGRLLLITLETDGKADQARAAVDEITEKLDAADGHEVLRYSRRAYPAIILADDELWIDLEQEPVANMALSPEESEVLESARRAENPFPLFINGRAGSGKSTILQYLFADLLFYYLDRPESSELAPPIYLTASGELLRVARKFVERLLRSEAIFTQSLAPELLAQSGPVLDEAFREFQPHLLSLITAPERDRRFSRSKHVDYAEFRRLWMERFGKSPQALRDFGPDISWHVVRSYIKGMSSETYMDSDDYSQLPENQITVTAETFGVVHDRVWKGWYEGICESDALWDDQDLTRFVLDHDLAHPIHPAVFCDEAQDFTRIELELLLRLNLYSERSLRPTDIERVPFAFAGDQFQTLNPTGFRWDSIKASFVEKFIFALDPARRSSRAELNYRELKFNYRSTRKIVRFGNHVQALRAALFQLPELKPQVPWTAESTEFPVVWFRNNNAAFWRKFRENASLVVVVPCNEGEESEFVRKDPVLREHIRTEDGIPLNVLSAARAKGCEYPDVLVYGFGEALPVEIQSVTSDAPAALDDDPKHSLPMQYFVNRLYVAVSRAKRRLVVVDTDKGLDQLWRWAQDEKSQTIMLRAIKNGVEVWGREVEGMAPGNPEDLNRDVAVDPLANAKAFELEGVARRDGFLLRQAAQAYRNGGDAAKERECRARALEAEGMLLEAGEGFFEAGFAVPDGLRCLWRAGRSGWVKLSDRLASDKEVQGEIEFQFARLIVHQAKPNDLVGALSALAARLADPRVLERCVGEASWRQGIEALLEKLLGDKESKALPYETWRRAAADLTAIASVGVQIPPTQTAHIYFRAKRYADAAQLWEALGDPAPPELFQAKAYIEPYPQRAETLSKLGSWNEIVDGYRQYPHATLTQKQADAVADALTELALYEDAFKVSWVAGTTGPMLRLAVKALRKNSNDVALRAVEAGILLLVKEAKWEALSSFSSVVKFQPTNDWKVKDVKEWVARHQDTLRNTLIRGLARSEDFAVASGPHKRRIVEFIRGYLRVKDRAWRSEVTIYEAGAAIERGGRFTDAIGYYEALLKEKTSKEEVRFAERRWLRSKQRQLEYERSQSAAPQKLVALEKDIKTAMKTLAIEAVDTLTQFPDLPAVEAPGVRVADKERLPVANEGPLPATATNREAALAEVAADTCVTVGLFKIDVSRRTNRFNITHLDTMETAFAKIAERACGGEVPFEQHEDSRWYCLNWNLAVIFPTSGQKLVRLEMPGLGINVEIGM